MSYTTTDVPQDHFNGGKNTTRATGKGPNLSEVARDLISRVGTSETDITAAEANITDILAYPNSITMPCLGDWAIDGDAVFTNGAGMSGFTPKTTHAAAAFAVCYDAGNTEYNLLSLTAAGTDYSANWQLLTDTKNDGDYVAFGNSIKFCEIGLDMSATVQTYTGDGVKYQYSKTGGTWGDLTVYDGTDATAQDGLRTGGQDGAIAFAPPADWVTTTINGQLGYWIRCIVVTNANVNIVGLTNGKNHYIVTPNEGYAAPYDMRIVKVHISDAAATLHSTADVKFLVWNFTTGVGAEVTFAQDIRTETVTLSSSILVSAGDELGVVVTQEDTAAEPSGVILNLIGTRV